MKTYQDLLEAGLNSENVTAEQLMEFTKEVVFDYRGSEMYDVIKTAENYDKGRNTTILNYRKLLYTLTGQAIDDTISANYKIASRFYNRFTTQQVQFLLGNGVTWENESTAERLGGDFDVQLQKVAKYALNGVGYGFFNKDHVEVFKGTEFAPLFDEENGALMAGVRFWQVSTTKPLRATLYTLNGYVDYMWEDGVGTVLRDFTPYILYTRTSIADGTEIYYGENYPTFPVVPMFPNPNKQLELIGLREQIDAYDLIKSGFCNTIDEASIIYWTINNAGGMDDVDLATFVERIKTVHAAIVEDTGATAESHTLEAPYQGRETLLDRLESDMYKDYMALNVDEIKGGANTATQIRAAYEPMNNKADQFEYCVIDFINGILEVAGIDDKPTFTRSYLINTQEEIATVLQAATYLDDEYVTRKILTLLGDADKAEEVLQAMEDYDYKRTMGEESLEEE